MNFYHLVSCSCLRNVEFIGFDLNLLKINPRYLWASVLLEVLSEATRTKAIFWLFCHFLFTKTSQTCYRSNAASLWVLTPWTHYCMYFEVPRNLSFCWFLQWLEIATETVLLHWIVLEKTRRVKFLWTGSVRKFNLKMFIGKQLANPLHSLFRKYHMNEYRILLKVVFCNNITIWFRAT